MKKLSAISPRTNAFMSSGGDPASEQVTFERMFSSLAYSAFSNKVPRLIDGIVTFKILTSDIDKGSAQGTFIVQAGNSFIYVPVVLNENNVEPPEVFYSKDLDSFLPLSNDWVDEIQKEDTSRLGGPGEIPKTLGEGLDVTNITVPPVTGKVTYASANIDLPEFLAEVPNRVKKAFATYLKNNPKSFKAAVKIHGNRIVESLQPRAEKVAAAPQPKYFVLDSTDSADRFKLAFGGMGTSAFQYAARHGAVVRDFRKAAELSIPVDAETPTTYHEIASSGLYKIIDSKGQVSVVAVFSDPTDIHKLSKPVHSYQGQASESSYYQAGPVKSPSKFLVVFPNGNYTILDKVIAVHTSDPLPDGVLRRALDGRTKVSLRNGKQILISTKDVWRGILPFSADNVASPSPGTMRGDVTDEWDTDSSGKPVLAGVIVSDKAGVNRPHSPPGSSTVFLPKSFTSIPCGEYVRPETIMTDATSVMALVNSGIAKLSHALVSVKNCGAGDYAVNGDPGYSKKEAIQKLASIGIEAEASLSFVSSVPSHRTKRAFVINSRNIPRLGRIFTKVAETDPAMVAQIAGAMAPAMLAQMQNMMGGQGAASAPPAAAAQGQAMQVDPATGYPIDPASGMPFDPATGMPIGPAAGMPAQAPQGAAVQAAPAAYAAPPAQGQVPQVDPSTGMAIDPSTGFPIDPATGLPIDPATGMPAQPGAVPGAPLPGASPQIDPNTGMPVDQPINPQFLNAAADLQHQGVFDVASVATLLQSPALTELVASYLPALQKSLDSLGRIVIAIKVKAPDLKQEIGQEAYRALDNKLLLVFRGLGELIIRLNQHTLAGVGAGEFNFYDGEAPGTGYMQ
jgi:hypothetical protein